MTRSQKAQGVRPKAQGLVKGHGARKQDEGLWLVTVLADSRKSARRAYVNCWIDFRLQDGALALAKFYLREEGWRPRSVTDLRWLQSPSDVPSAARRYYREARKDGASFVFYQYPKRRPAREK